MKKKITMIALVVALVAIMVVGGTLAYFVDKDAATNTFTVGNVDIDLTEPKWDETGKEEAKEVYPTEALAKDPTVENIGKNPCFVRISVTNLDQFGADKMITLRWIDESGVYHEGYNTEDWVEYNGYYYHKKPLCVKDTENDSWNAKYELSNKTKPVFSQIVMPAGLVGDETTKDIVVTAEAVQAQGAKASWAEVNAMDAEAIAAWFKTCMG